MRGTIREVVERAGWGAPGPATRSSARAPTTETAAARRRASGQGGWVVVDHESISGEDGERAR
jgi:hypothetical protein